ncbi:MAG: prenyltransferase [Sedimentisphaeraceae bacterium JB056]
MKNSKVIKLLCTPEPQFLLPGLCAIAVGTAAGAKDGGSVHWLYAILAVIAIVFINAGSNMLNDYFDHLSGNDWLNDNVTKFGGGSRYIQDGIVTPEAMRMAGAIAISIGAAIGIMIVILSGSLFILILGMAGFTGGLFWTAPPIKLCYRLPGEPHIFAMFGLLPTYGAYYLQHKHIEPILLIPASIIGIHIALVALINSIPDRKADAAVNKKTFTVRFGLKNAIILYKVLLMSAYLLSLLTILISNNNTVKAACIGHLYTFPIALICILISSSERLSKKNVSTPNGLTIAVYCLAGIAMTTAIIISG